MPVFRIGSDAWNRGFNDIADAMSEDPSKALHGAYYRQQALKTGMEAQRLERQAKIAADMQQMFTTDGPFAIMHDPAKFHAYSGMVIGGADPDDPLKMTQAATSLYGQSPESFEAAQQGGPYGGIDAPAVRGTAPAAAPSAMPSAGPQMGANPFHIADLDPAFAQARSQWEGEIVARAQRAGVDPHLALKVAEIESGYNPDAMSPKGYKGLFQLGTGAATDQGVNRDNPLSNIEGGIGYIKQMLDANNGDPRLAMAAYNWGPDNLKKHGIGAMPPETRNYLAKLGLSDYVPQAAPQKGGLTPASMPARPQAASIQDNSDQVMPTQAANQALIPVFAKSGKGAQSAMGMSPMFADRINRMLNAMPEHLRNQVSFNSGFRTFQEQKAIWDRTPEARRHKYVAEPGHSNHEHGIALDMNMRGMSPELTGWLDQNEGRFGLHRRLAHENWHFEPIEATKDDQTWGQRMSAEMSHAPSAMETNPVNAEAASTTLPEVDVTASAGRPGYSIPGIPPGITDPRLERMIYASGLNPHGPDTFTGMMLKEAGDTVRTQIQHPEGVAGDLGGAFVGKSMDAQAARIITDYNAKKAQGVQTTPQEDLIYSLAYAHTFKERTEVRTNPDTGTPDVVTIRPNPPPGIVVPGQGAAPSRPAPAPAAPPPVGQSPSAPPSTGGMPPPRQVDGVTIQPTGRPKPKPLTEGQDKNRAFATRMIGAHGAMQGKPSYWDHIVTHDAPSVLGRDSAAGSFVGSMGSEQGKKIELASREFVAALLRKDSGAAVTDNEMSFYSSYIPLPGDSKEQLAQKAEMRQRVIESFKANPDMTPEQIVEAAARSGSRQAPVAQPGASEEENDADASYNEPEENAEGDDPQMKALMRKYGSKK